MSHEIEVRAAYDGGLEEGMRLKQAEVDELNEQLVKATGRELALQRQATGMIKTHRENLATLKNQVIEECTVKCDEHKAKYLKHVKDAFERCKCENNDCECGEYEQGHITAVNMLIKYFRAMKDEGGSQ